MVSRFDVVQVNLNPTVGSEIRKVRPCLVISPDEMNHSKFNTVIVAPMTTKGKLYLPTRIPVIFDNKQGLVVLDQIRTIDESRIVRVLGVLPDKHHDVVLETLQEIFAV